MTELPTELEEFVRLFNQGRYFEAHEVLEDLWKKTSGGERAFYQGLIQCAVALHHLRSGNRAGADYECRKAGEKLDAFPERHGGVAVGRLREDLRRCVREGAGEAKIFLE